MIHLEYQTLIHNNFKVQGQQVALCDALFFLPLPLINWYLQLLTIASLRQTDFSIMQATNFSTAIDQF